MRLDRIVSGVFAAAQGQSQHQGKRQDRRQLRSIWSESQPWPHL
jgi:hypothetical protein